ncbi:hypothetical protein [Streptomyces sp. NPDC059874]|uniref:hypothetical protein n=1 Tax=Streptomyces sp. NPDC059874 TaxID=3346983 RepID=UPI00364E7CCD
MQTIQEKVRGLLQTVREVDEWREEYDPATPEWHTLCDLSDRVAGLIYSLPMELIPEEEIREVIGDGSGTQEILDILASLLTKEGE